MKIIEFWIKLASVVFLGFSFGKFPKGVPESKIQLVMKIMNLDVNFDKLVLVS